MSPTRTAAEVHSVLDISRYSWRMHVIWSPAARGLHKLEDGKVELGVAVVQISVIADAAWGRALACWGCMIGEGVSRQRGRVTQEAWPTA